MTIHGQADVLPASDALVANDYGQATGEWNSILDPVVRDLTDPNVPDSVSAAELRPAVSKLRPLVGQMRRTAAKVEHDGLRQLLRDRADVYAAEVSELADLASALARGDASAQRAIGLRMIERSKEAAALSREALEVADKMRQ